MTAQAVPPWMARIRPWLAAAGGALIVAGLAIEGLARRYVAAESAQFVMFAMAAPALIVLGAPWRLLRLSRAPASGTPASPWPASLTPASATSAGPASASPMTASPAPDGPMTASPAPDDSMTASPAPDGPMTASPAPASPASAGPASASPMTASPAPGSPRRANRISGSAAASSHEPAGPGEAGPASAGPGMASPGPAGRPGPLDRLAAARQRQTSFWRAGGYLVAFIAVSVTWRLPPIVDALGRHPVLVLPELVTLLAVGIGLWLELAPSPPLAPRLPKPQRAAVAALAMWSAWAAAYVLGLSNHGVFHGYDPAGGALSAVADQQITVALVWAVSACCFVPVVFVALLTWLSGNGDPDEELQRLARDERQHPVVRGWGRPARGRPGR